MFAKGFLKLPNLHTVITQKSPSLPRNVALRTFGKLPIAFSKNLNLLYLLCSVALKCCLLHLIKQNCQLKNFSKNSNLEGSGISLPVFASRTNLKLSKIVKKVIMKFYSSKVSHLDFIPVVVLKNCGPELSHTLAEFIIKCLKKSFFFRLLKGFKGGSCV